MKKTVPAGLRKGIMIALAVLCIGAAAGSVWWYLQPREQEQQVPVFECQHGAAVDYQVLFKPNDFFPDLESAGPGVAYLVPLTESVQTTLNYKYTAQAAAQVSGKCEAEARVTGYMYRDVQTEKGLERQRVKVWEKAEQLLPPTTFSSQEKEVELAYPVTINLQDYIDFADEIKSELKYGAEEVELAVNYHVNVQAVTGDGTVQEEFKPSLIIPIKGAAFYVDGKLVDEKTSTVTKPEMEPITGVTLKFKGFGAAALVLAILLVLFIRKTEPLQVDPVDKELNRIVKKYGDRVLAGTGKLPVAADRLLFVSSFMDLVKVSDDLSLPILYEETDKNTHSFCVLGDILTYCYILSPDTLKDEF